MKNSKTAFLEFKKALGESKKSAKTLKTEISTVSKTLNKISKTAGKYTTAIAKQTKAVNDRRRSNNAFAKTLKRDERLQRKSAAAARERASALLAAAKAQTKNKATAAVLTAIKNTNKALERQRRLIKANTGQTRQWNTQLAKSVALLTRLARLKGNAALGSAFGGGSTGGGIGRKGGLVAGIIGNAAPLRGFLNQLGQIEKRTNRISFTFRRLFGILAAFLIVRKAAQAFVGLVRSAIEFNSVIEKSTLGISSLITASFDLRNSLGKAVAPAEQLVLAQVEARKQMTLLRQDSLKTAATFEQLLTAFQVSIAPGAIAGLDLTEIRTFTVRISQAAAALGVAQNQLAEEIRSILQGTINIRTTRVAAALGITNKDIKQAKEAGELVQFLNDRFSAFAAAEKESLKLFEVILANLKQATSLVLGTGLKDFFDELKDSLKAVQDILLEENPLTGILEPDTDVITVLKEVSSVLETAVTLSREFVENLSGADVLSVVTATSSTLKITLELAVIAANLLFDAFVATSAIINGMMEEVKKGVEAFKSFLPDNRKFIVLLDTLVAISTTLFTIKATWAVLIVLLTPILAALLTIKKTIALIVVSVLSLGKGFLFLAPIVAKAFLPITAAIALFASLAALTLVITKELGLWELKLTTIIDFIKEGIPAAFDILVATIKGAILTLAVFLVDNLTSSFITATDAIIKVLEITKLAANEVSKELGASLDPLIEKAKDLEKILKKPGDELKGILEDTQADFHLALNKYDQALKDASKNNETNKTISQIFTDSFNDIGNKVDAFINTSIDSMKDRLADAGTEAKSFVDELNDLPAILAKSDSAFKEQLKTVEQLKDKLLDVKQGLDISRSTRGFGGAIADSIRISKETEFEIEEKTLHLTQDIIAAEKTKLGVQTKLRVAHEEANKLTLLQRASIDAIIVLQKENLLAQEKERTLKLASAALEKKITRLKAEGDESGEDIARKKLEDSKTFEKSQRRIIENTEDNITKLKEGFGHSEAAQKKIADLSKDIISLSTKETQLTININKTLEVRAQIEKALNKIKDARIQKIKEEAKEEQRLNNIRFQTTLAFDQIDRDTERRERQNPRGGAAFDNFLERERTRREIDALTTERSRGISDEAVRRDINLRQEQLRAQTKLLRDLPETKRIPLIREIHGMETELLAVARQQSAVAGEITQEVIRRNRELANTPNFGDVGREEGPLKGAYEQILSQIPFLEDRLGNILNNFQQNIVDTFNTIKDDTSEILAEGVAAGLGLSDKEESIREQFSKLFKQVGKDMVKALVKELIDTGLSALKSLIKGSFGQPTGLAKGGVVPNKGTATLAHATAKGYSQGGSSAFRPKGLDPKDTVPAWLQPGEYVHTVAAVRKYGTDFMEAVRSLALDPVSARSLLNNVKVRKQARRSGRVGYATGGEITRSRPAQATNVQVSSAPARVVMVADEESYERMTAQGTRPLIRAIQENADEIRPFLSDSRGNNG
jgi:hypothetical protein